MVTVGNLVAVDDWRDIVGRNVRKQRQAVGLTQEQLAFAAQIDITYVGGIERGRRNPSVIVLARIAQALGTEPANLLQR